MIPLSFTGRATSGKYHPVRRIEGTGDVNFLYFDESENTLYAASSQGIMLLDLDSYAQKRINQNSGLPNQFIYALTKDANGHLWASTNAGILSFDPNAQPLRVKQYTTLNGLSSNEFIPGAVLRDRNGFLWWGSTRGVDVFHPDSLRDIGHAPKLALVGLKIHDQAWQGDSAITMLQRLDLPYNQNTLRFELAAMEYLDPSRNQFKVMLQRQDEPAVWANLGTQNFVTYANLKPGKYQFRFIACNAEGIWVEETKSRNLVIFIHPHWSDTWWFRTLLALSVLGLVALGTSFYYRYRLHLQQLDSEKKQRVAELQRRDLAYAAAVAEQQRKATESEMKLLRAQLNPHFLFNAMNSVNRYILLNEKDKASAYLGDFARLTRSILDNSRNLTISLSDELTMLEHYLRLESHRFDQQITWDISVDPALDPFDVLVPSMFLQPFAENAILHGLAPRGSGHIQVRVLAREELLCCLLRDNGVGRKLKSVGQVPHRASLGMKLISERLNAFANLQGGQAEVVIRDLTDQEGLPLGTEVEVCMPLQLDF
jgi:two-component sensor histidine kinase